MMHVGLNGMTLRFAMFDLTEKEQSDEVLRDEIIKVSTPYSSNEHTEHNPFFFFL